MRSMDTLEARLRAAGFRVRAMRALEAAVWGAAGAAGVAALVALTHWVSPALVPAPGLALCLGLLAMPVAAALVAMSREVAELPVLAAFDRSHGLSDLLSSAWALGRLPDERRGPFVTATLERAERAAAAIEIRRSFPWQRPRGLLWLGIATLVAVVSVLGRNPQPTAAGSTAPRQQSPALERLVSPEQLAAFRARLARLDANAGQAVTPVRAELERILDEIGQPADRLQVLRRLGELERNARGATPDGRAARNAATRSSAAPSSPPVPPTAADPAAPLEHSEPAAAPAPAEGAAPPQVPAASEAKPASQPTAAAPPDVPKPQAPDRSAQPQADPDDPSADPPPQSGGQSSSPPAANEARPVAASASPGGTDDNGPRGPDLERKRAPQNPPGQRDENLADAISELRDLMRRDQSVHADLEGSQQAPQLPRERPDPNRDESKGNRPGAPNAAYASGGPPQVGMEARDSKREEVPQLPAEATRISGARSAGPVRSQVIYGAAQRGFASSDYAQVHAEYEDHAERELDREAVPPAYRGYVRRYFEAIGPRKSP